MTKSQISKELKALKSDSTNDNSARIAELESELQTLESFKPAKADNSLLEELAIRIQDAKSKSTFDVKSVVVSIAEVKRFNALPANLKQEGTAVNVSPIVGCTGKLVAVTNKIGTNVNGLGYLQQSFKFTSEEVECDKAVQRTDASGKLAIDTKGRYIYDRVPVGMQTTWNVSLFPTEGKEYPLNVEYKVSMVKGQCSGIEPVLSSTKINTL